MEPRVGCLRLMKVPILQCEGRKGVFNIVTSDKEMRFACLAVLC